MHSTIDRSGRVVIPKVVRDELHLTPGTALSVEERNGEIVFRPTSFAPAAEPEPALRRKNGLLVFSGQPAGDLLEAVDKQRRERARLVAAWQAE